MLLAQRFDRVADDEARRAGFETVGAPLAEAGRHAEEGTPLFRVPVGYELSPRGKAVLADRDRRRG